MVEGLSNMIKQRIDELHVKGMIGDGDYLMLYDPSKTRF